MGLVMIGTLVYEEIRINDGSIPVRKIHSIDVEYSIEILNQDSVKVYSHSTHKLYTVPFNSIDSVLLIDNI